MNEQMSEGMIGSCFFFLTAVTVPASRTLPYPISALSRFF